MRRWGGIVLLVLLSAAAVALPFGLRQAVPLSPHVAAQLEAAELAVGTENGFAIEEVLEAMSAADDGLGQFLRAYAALGRIYVGGADRLGPWAWSLLGVFLSMSVLSLIIKWKGFGRASAMTFYTLGSVWLLFLSLASVIVFFVFRVNLWALLPAGAWLAPSAAILTFAVLMQFVDENYPIWNSTVSSFSAPVAACVIILAWNAMAGGPPF
jgi:hypothetical protein